MLEKIVVTGTILLCLLLYLINPSINSEKIKSNHLNSVSQIFVLGDGISTGTGFSIGKSKKDGKNLILTNFHICSDAVLNNSPVVLTKNGSSEDDYYFGEVVKFNISKDLCLIKSNIDLKKINIKDRCKKEEKIKIIGAPNGVFPIILDSYISIVKIDSEGIPFLELDPDSEIVMVSAQLLPGHSGSPIISKDGLACGIIFAANTGGYGGFGMSGLEIKDFINSYSEF